MIHIKNLVGGGYDEFWTCKKRYRAIKGSRASKKSCTFALWYIFHIMKFFHAYGVKPCLLVVRKFQNTHRNSTRAQLIWAIKKLKCEHYWNIPKADNTLTYKPSGQTIIFRGLDDPQSLTSITVDEGYLCWAWIEEAFQLTHEMDFDKLDLSFRGQVPDPLFKQLSLSLNAWHDLHWIKSRFFDNPDQDTFSDTTTYKGNEFLDAADHAVFLKMKKNNPRRYKIEGLGLWGSVEGAIYQDYIDAPEKNHIETVDEKLQFLSAALDYGSGSQDSKLGKTTMTAVGFTTGFEKVYVIDETYFNDIYTPDRVVKWALDFLETLRLKYKLKIEVYCEWASSSALNNALKLAVMEKGLQDSIIIQDAFKSTIQSRIDLVQLLLADKRLLLTPAVPETKKALKTAMWDSEKSRLKKLPIRLDNGSSNICSLDVLEYAIISYNKYLQAAGFKYKAVA